MKTTYIIYCVLIALAAFSAPVPADIIGDANGDGRITTADRLQRSTSRSQDQPGIRAFWTYLVENSPISIHTVPEYLQRGLTAR